MPTQMGEFDFISVLISLIIGLGITNLVSGAGRVFYRRRKNPIDEDGSDRRDFAHSGLELVGKFFVEK